MINKFKISLLNKDKLKKIELTKALSVFKKANWKISESEKKKTKKI